MELKELHELFLNSSGISTDTRKIKPGCLFFALKGENFNANEFATEAIDKGAGYAVIDDKISAEGDRYIKVDNVLETLQQLARFHRRQLAIPVLALTGSNGKTTTKELINAVLSQKFKTTATLGNLNNHIGVPLTLLSMTEETELGIVEMGANHQKEINFLSRIAEPDFGYITNFGKAHLQGFGSAEGVIKGKKELYDYLKEEQKMLFLNMDDPRQQEETSYSNTFSYGENPSSNIRVTYYQENSFAGIEVENQKITGKLLGSYNARNMAAAYAIGRYFEITPERIKEALESYVPQNNRSQIIEKNGNKIILDAYNANPTSMAVALENFAAMEKTPKTAFLGDMFELGVTSAEEHQQLVEKLEDQNIDKVYLIGSNLYKTKPAKSFKKFSSFEDFKNNFNPAEVKGSLILIKGSRGMALERILDLL